jgi:peptide deformylase
MREDNFMLSIAKYPDPRLKQASQEVAPEELGATLAEKMNLMEKTMRLFKGVGLAGVQVGDMRRILVARCGKICHHMVNPVWEHMVEKTEISQEGCLSFPRVSKKMKRYSHIKVTWISPYGDIHKEEFHGQFAYIVQHECDHLDGKTI